jgi:acetate kinase
MPSQEVGSLISAPDSRVEVHVIPTDEEAMIGQHTLDTLAARAE